MKKTLAALLLVLALTAMGANANTIWSEDFSSYIDAGITGAGNSGGYPGSVAKWSIDVSNCILSDAGDYFMAVDTSGGRMEAVDIDGEAVWTSESIDIGDYMNVFLSVDTSETGSSTSESKYVRLFYKLNGGAEIPFAVNPTNSGNWGSATATQDGLSGSTLQIVARVNNPNSGDASIFDNVIVNGIIVPAGMGIFAYCSFETSGDMWGYARSPVSFNVVDAVWAATNSLSTLTPTHGARFWGMQDLDCPSNSNSSGNAYLTFNTVDISSATSVFISFDYEVIGWDTDDDLWYEIVTNGVSLGEVQIVDGYSNKDQSGTVSVNIPDVVDSVVLKIHARQDGGTDYGMIDNVVIGGVGSGTTSSGVDLRAYQAADGVYVEFVAYDVEEDGTIQLALMDANGNPVWTGTANVVAGPQAIARFLVPGLELGETYSFSVRDEVGKVWSASGVGVKGFDAEMVSMSPAGAELSFDSIPGREYDIQWSAGLGGSWDTVDTATASEGDATTVVVPYPDGEEGKGFFRIQQK